MVKCYRPGVPRATYMPFPFQIIQTPEQILIAYEFAGAARRILYVDQPDFEAPVESWMGHSRAHWEGETLVVEVTGAAARHLVRQLGELSTAKSCGWWSATPR